LKNKLATLQDRLDNPLKDDYTALQQLEKTLPLSELAKKKFNMFFNKKTPKIAAMSVPTYAKIHKKKVNLQITYLQNGKSYSNDFSCNIQTSDPDEINDLQDKAKNNLGLIVSDVHKQLNDKTSEYIYLEKYMFILNKKDFLNCQVTIEDIS
jgi:hypothetical protein